uniref:Protein fantom n=1 Tax=Anthurium amnicola TaxID=1678845 RepID=A0A1D1YD56_9ARAE
MEASVAGGASSAPAGRRVMVVADPGRESAGALQWALTHAVLEHDELILLHVDPPNPRRGPFSVFLRRPPSHGGGGGAGSAAAAVAFSAEGVGGNYEFMDGMKARCKQVQPTVKVQVERVEMEDNDKATTILSQTKALGVELLVIGQPRRSFLGLGGGNYTKSMDMAEYLIENSKCLCVGVQKKGQNAGYVLNTKTHRNFWLLA